jgi:hypothetical protein
MSIAILGKGSPNWQALAYGVTNEAGINISRCIVRYFPEVDENVMDAYDQTIWRVQSANLSRSVEIEGEIIKNVGVMVFTLATALTFANVMSSFGNPHGSFYLDEATTTYARNGWQKVNIKATARPTL